MKAQAIIEELVVTMEDIIEELVGEIYDEHDEVEILVKEVEENVYIVSGDENVEDMYERLGLAIPKDIESTTVGGYVIELMDKIPAPGEKVFLKDMEIEVTNASEKHVKEVKVTVRELDEDEERNED